MSSYHPWKGSPPMTHLQASGHIQKSVSLVPGICTLSTCHSRWAQNGLINPIISPSKSIMPH
eukprot:CAMPEP_0119111162 /NCGR_PEP_ID=MMETSP1180-20130426/34251_1 /TAXON_ID=3052 ORGANISM="Chlamydomonas cf sp, Strain CCMP681" /NCGR_SAMPLE_ID=MMETSP1180 /ASSEMBLY_ACC=CAM_ASM_000741 /LENGTH=61 /DNA_ID=CAMNT_0007097969 /DNA_START=84 /DNA_END=269 /DNA_ORIENTATION=-